MKKFLITGGAGFIGSALVRHIINNTRDAVINIDKLTYAGNLESLKSVEGSNRYQFVKGDICDSALVKETLEVYRPDYVMHLAAESHVDRSIDGPGDFIQTNIVGTYTLLECTKAYYAGLSKTDRETFKFHHISTDEVYGDLGKEGLFTESTAYDPSSPYSASKASSDHLVRAWGRTYGLPVIITNCSNNYGPFHFPEKLIPLIILNALEGKPLPVYGDGKQVRDWLYVEDHARALHEVVRFGKVGDTYNIGGFNEKQNIDVVTEICNILNKVVIEKPLGISDFKSLIQFVSDRPGHDVRYAIDATKIKNELNWVPNESFSSGIKKTVDWYLNNQEWIKNIQNGGYKSERLGKKVINED